MIRRVFAQAVSACVGILVPAALPAEPSKAVAETNAPTTLHDKNSVDPATLALARQILTLEFPPAKRPQMYHAMMQSIVDQSLKSVNTMGVHDKDLQKVTNDITQHMFDELTATIIPALPDYFESMARAYARNFSRDDLKAILTFVKTPAGQHFFERIPLIVKDPDVQAAGERMMTRMMKKAPEMVREQKQQIDAYIAKTQK